MGNQEITKTHIKTSTHTHTQTTPQGIPKQTNTKNNKHTHKTINTNTENYEIKTQKACNQHIT